MAQVVVVPRYKPEIASSIPDRVLPAHYGTGVDSASNRNKHQGFLMGVGKDCRCVGLTTLRPTCAVTYSLFLACVGRSLQITPPFSCTDRTVHVT